MPLRDDQGKVIRWYSVGVDIDNQKSAEDALRRSEARLAAAERELQLTIDTIPTLVAAYGPDGSRIFVNRRWREYMGLRPDDAVDVFEPPSFIPTTPRACLRRQRWRTSGEPFTRGAGSPRGWRVSVAYVHRVLLRDESAPSSNGNRRRRYR